MNGATRTVIWREYKEYLQAQGKERAGLIVSVLMIFSLPFVFAFILEDYWRAIASCLGLGIFASMSVIMGFVPYSMAGERERHTLETLLSTRMPGRSIYWGKFIAATSFALAVGSTTVLVSILGITAIFKGAWSNLGLALLAWVGSILFALPIVALGAAVGLFVSARAATTQQAATKTSFLLMPFIMLVFLGPVSGTFAGLFLFGETNLAAFIALGGLLGFAVLAAVAVGVVVLGLRRFERHRLMLT